MQANTSRINVILWVIVILGVTLFLLANHFKLPPHSKLHNATDIQVVISPPIQTIMYAGDRFLAANLEAIRASAIGPSDERSFADYRIRAHTVVSQLNPCHEDNVYLSNALLSWGGSIDAGNAILQRATDCRIWDDIPPFFLGFNRYFFKRDFAGAKQAIDIAASRSKENRIPLLKLSTMITVKQFNDEKIAAEYLRGQRDQATDPRLVKMLDDRLKRLEGLLVLRDAQKQFEQRFKRKLQTPNELFTSKILASVPNDPLGLGYEFRNGEFVLKQMKVAGMEIN